MLNKVLYILVNIMVFNLSFAQGYDYQDLRQRIVDDRRTGNVAESTLDNWVTSQQQDGSWLDLNYSSATTSKNHVLRLWHLSVAVTRTGANYDNTSYKAAIKKGLEYWLSSNTVDNNWWYNKIYYPQKLGELLIFLRELNGFIPETSATSLSEDDVLAYFSPTSIPDITSRGDGANAIDIAVHYVYRGFLTEDDALLEQTRDKLESILTNYIQPDMIYHDHGPQIMTASYGWVFCNGIVNLASYLADTPAAFDTNQGNFKTVLEFIKTTQASSIRGRYWDFSVMGRSVSRKGALNASMHYLQKIADNIDPDNSTQYLDILDRLKGTQPPDYKVNEFNKHYFVSDYTQHSRPEYLFTVRNTSKRTVEAESGNGENLKANFFSYGATFMSVTGEEYYNIMPLWDWSMIPGTTFPHTTTFPSRQQWGFNYGQTDFVGGVSDGMYGASTLHLNKGRTTARKSWFFFDDEMVCLGAGIYDYSGKNVRTTINQAWLDEPSFISEFGSSTEASQSLSSNTYAPSNLEYIRNGDFGYYFKNQQDVKYTMTKKTGSWNSINSNASSEQKSGYVFSLWLDHGSNPQNDSYNYIVVPGINTEAKAQSYNPDTIEIIQNDHTIQAVYNNALDVFQVIFHQPGSVSIGNKTITVGRPCALILKEGNKVSVSDPNQNDVASVNVTIEVDGQEHFKQVPLPGNEMKGSTSNVTFENILALDSQRTALDVRLFPNPTSDSVKINTPNNDQLAYELYDLKGMRLGQGNLTNDTEIDLSGFSSGVYLVKVRNRESVESTYKIIKR